ncbi:MAG: hypothetical protein WBA10_04570 [Elainellaceae cyanobacterium]
MRLNLRAGLCRCLPLLLLAAGCSAKSSIVSLNPPQAVPRVEQIPQAPKETIAALPDDVQIYRDENEMFVLALPKDYTYESSDRSMTFAAPDGGFGGEVDYAAAEASLTPPKLEERLKQMLQERFVEVSWEDGSANEQSDGSLRLDWQGISSDGQQLDALSFIEQHGEVVYILTAHGVDRPYKDYNDDARIIVGSYVVRQDPPSVE